MQSTFPSTNFYCRSGMGSMVHTPAPFPIFNRDTESQELPLITDCLRFADLGRVIFVAIWGKAGWDDYPIRQLVNIQNTSTGWWLSHPSEKYESQLGWLFPIYGKINNVPNHQPVNQLWKITFLKTTLENQPFDWDNYRKLSTGTWLQEPAVCHYQRGDIQYKCHFSHGFAHPICIHNHILSFDRNA